MQDAFPSCDLVTKDDPKPSARLHWVAQDVTKHGTINENTLFACTLSHDEHPSKWSVIT